MSRTLDAESLLAGPRGRRLCLSLLVPDGSSDPEPPEQRELRLAVFYATYELDPGCGTSVRMFGPGHDEAARPRPTPDDVARLLADVPVPVLDENTLLAALAASVDNARYWQEPDGEDVLAATAHVRGELERVAEAVVRSAAAAWWSTVMVRDDQHCVRFPRQGPPAPDVATILADEAASVRASEAEHARLRLRRDPAAEGSGVWWSAPPSGLVSSTRRLAGRGPVGLHLVEDADDAEVADVSRVMVPEAARVLEIDGPQAWADLCRRHPLEVSRSRRGDWFRATGRDGRWAAPDWSSVAREAEGVHLSVAGYLTTAGRAVPVSDDVATVLAGWNPDATYWLRGARTGPEERVTLLHTIRPE